MIITRYKNYIHIHSDLVLTNWNKENILDYTGSKNVYCNTDEEVSTYYEITEAEHFANEEAREMAEMPTIEENKIEE